MQNFISDVAFLLQETIDAFEELVGKGLDFRSGVGIGGENIQSVFLGFSISRGKGDASDFKAISDDGVDSHGLFLTLLGDANCNLVHFAIVVLLLFFLRLLLLLAFILVLQVGRRFDVGDESNLVISDLFAHFDLDVFSGDGPSLLFVLVLEGGKIS